MTTTAIEDHMTIPSEPSIDKILSLLPKEAVELLGQCSEPLQHVVISTTGNIYKDCEAAGIILDPIQNEIFINAFVRATTANSAFFLQQIDRSNQVIGAMTNAYAELGHEVEKLKTPMEPVRRSRFRKTQRPEEG